VQRNVSRVGHTTVTAAIDRISGADQHAAVAESRDVVISANGLWLSVSVAAAQQ